MRALSAGCSCCGARRNQRMPGGVLLCRRCDTASVAGNEDGPRGAPPRMPGTQGGYTVEQQTPVTPEEQA